MIMECHFKSHFINCCHFIMVPFQIIFLKMILLYIYILFYDSFFTGQTPLDLCPDPNLCRTLVKCQKDRIASSKMAKSNTNLPRKPAGPVVSKVLWQKITGYFIVILSATLDGKFERTNRRTTVEFDVSFEYSNFPLY